jgi:hypothetical protein
MARKAKKGSSRYYFTQKTEDAIIRYNHEPSFKVWKETKKETNPSQDERKPLRQIL